MLGSVHNHVTHRELAFVGFAAGLEINRQCQALELAFDIDSGGGTRRGCRYGQTTAKRDGGANQGGVASGAPESSASLAKHAQTVCGRRIQNLPEFGSHPPLSLWS